MQPAGNCEQEKDEVSKLLASGIFNRAPNLSLLLNYVCAKHFEGAAEQIKEYNIAVEAFGRPAEFDQKADSIVRVEAHRLRKRLREYYDNEGAEHAVHIEIPPGQYAPKFIHRTAPYAAPAAAQTALPETVTAELPHAEPVLSNGNGNRVVVPDAPEVLPVITGAAKPIPIWRVLAIAVVVLAAGASVSVWSRGRTRSAAHANSIVATTVPAGDTIRILCGLERGSYIDHFGNTWAGDRYFQGGQAVEVVNHHIRGTRDPKLYNTRREGGFRYDIPLKPGTYELRLHFAETVYGEDNPAGGGETSRVFNVRVNGKEMLHEFDVVEDAGSSSADIKVFKDIGPAADGKLHLEFEPLSNQPILSGIEISPGIQGRMGPIRMVARDHAYTGKDGSYWEPDRYANGGQLVMRNSVISGAPDPDLYSGERFGNISYVIPVAEGRYRITLHFAETWFGPGKTGGGDGPGKRVFDIMCNGVAVRRNFDIFKEAGGSDRATTLTIPDAVPNHQGKLVVSLVPVTNYACINAIEVLDESR